MSALSGDRESTHFFRQCYSLKRELDELFSSKKKNFLENRPQFFRPKPRLNGLSHKSHLEKGEIDSTALPDPIPRFLLESVNVRPLPIISPSQPTCASLLGVLPGFGVQLDFYNRRWFQSPSHFISCVFCQISVGLTYNYVLCVKKAAEGVKNDVVILMCIW